MGGYYYIVHRGSACQAGGQIWSLASCRTRFGDRLPNQTAEMKLDLPVATPRNGGPIFLGLFFLGGLFFFLIFLGFPRENSSFLTFWTDLA